MVNDPAAQAVQRTRALLLALAGLLHDVGKLAEASGVAPAAAWDAGAAAKFGRVHALLSAEFVQRFVPAAWQPIVLDPVAHHHVAQSLDACRTEAANRFGGSTMGRIQESPAQRVILLSTVAGAQPSVRRVAPAAPLALTPALFAGGDANGSFSAAWALLEEQAGDLHARFADAATDDAESLTQFIDGMQAILQRSLWPLASSPDQDGSTGLFEHSRMTSAFAAAFAELGKVELDRIRNDRSGKVHAALLISGDLSGIQRFIYAIASAGAARSLRARSFYVQLLTEALARMVMRSLGLPSTAAIFVGGGGFVLLAPLSAKNALPLLRERLAERLLAMHGAALGFTLESEEIAANEWGRYGEVHSRLGQKLHRAKRRPFAAASAEALHAAIGVPIGCGGLAPICAVTGEELRFEDAADVSEDAADRRSPFVASLEDLGIDLRHARFLALADVAEERAVREPLRDWRTALLHFGFSATLLDGAGAPLRQNQRLPDVPLRVGAFQPDDAPRRLRGQDVAFYYPLAQCIPWSDETGRPKLFDELAAEATGFRRWAVLRMDVDNLGALFRSGLGRRSTPARASQLSFELRLFFEGWLPELARRFQTEGAASPGDRLYIQYAGGDDVFVVGSWDAIAAFALDVRRAFRRYVGGDHLTVSAGIVLAEANHPIAQAAQEAEEAEAAAKRFTAGKRQKDAVTFLGVTLGWEDYETVYRRAMQLRDLCGPGGVGRSLLQTLQQLHVAADGEQLRRRVRRQPQTQYTRATWLAAYQLTRVHDRLGGDAAARSLVDSLRTELLAASARTEHIALAARWAQYLLR